MPTFGFNWTTATLRSDIDDADIRPEALGPLRKRKGYYRGLQRIPGCRAGGGQEQRLADGGFSSTAMIPRPSFSAPELSTMIQRRLVLSMLKLGPGRFAPSGLLLARGSGSVLVWVSQRQNHPTNSTIAIRNQCWNCAVQRQNCAMAEDIPLVHSRQFQAAASLAVSCGVLHSRRTPSPGSPLQH
jgi:hypothetical protein